jgi:methionyl-tRNA formyltransferase
MEIPKIIFMGSHSIAFPLLEYLVAEEVGNVVLSGVVTQPDRPSQRGQKLSPNPITVWARDRAIPLFQPEKPTEETVAWIGERGCDLILVMAYGHILGKAIRELPRRGIFNFHASLLPRFRGAAPIEAAIASGVSATGISLMEVVKEMDAGDVLDRQSVPIGAWDHNQSLAEKLSFAAKEVLKRNLGALLGGTFRREVQDREGVTFCRKIEKGDIYLDFSHSAEQLVWRIRALTPHPGCVIGSRDEFYKIESYRWLSDLDCEPGQIFLHGDDLCIGCGDRTAILLHSIQRPGRKKLPVKAFLNGNGDFLKMGKVDNFTAMRPFEAKVFPF